SSCGGATSGGCIVTFNIGSGTTGTPPTIGPWLPNWSHYLTNSEVVDTKGNIQKAGFPGAYATGAITFSAQPNDWYYEGYYSNLAYYSGFGFNVGDYNPGNGASPYVFANSTTFADFYCPGALGSDVAGQLVDYTTCIQILRGADNLTETMQNTMVAINFSGTCGYSYPGYTNLCNDISTSYGGAANSVLTATGYTSSSVLLQARSVGTAGNGYCWTTNPANYANISNSGSCLSGGRNAGPPGTTNSTVPTTWNTATSGTTTDNQVTWTNAGASNGQTTAVQATGTSGIVIDNVYNPPWAASTNYRA